MHIYKATCPQCCQMVVPRLWIGEKDMRVTCPLCSADLSGESDAPSFWASALLIGAAITIAGGTLYALL